MSSPLPLSVVIIAKNERSNIQRCLESLAWCSERVVVDDESTDGTREAAENLGARVVSHRFESFAAQRNWALESAELCHEWVLMLDADEVATPAFRDAVGEAIQHAQADVVGFCLCRKTMLLGKWLRYSDGFPVWIMRLVRQKRAQFADSGHGEIPVPAVFGRLEKITEPFVHYPFSKGLSDWWQRHNAYSSREAQREFVEDRPLRWGELFSRETSMRRRAQRDFARRLPFRSLARFCYHYFWKWGILEGRAGLAFSFLMATYEGMIVLKRWELVMMREGRNL